MSNPALDAAVRMAVYRASHAPGSCFSVYRSNTIFLVRPSHEKLNQAAQLVCIAQLSSPGKVFVRYDGTHTEVFNAIQEAV